MTTTDDLWTIERALEDGEGWIEYALSLSPEEFEAHPVAIELDRQWQEELAQMTPAQRALVRKQDAELDAIMAAEDDPDDDPEPADGEELPRPLAADARSIRGPPRRGRQPGGLAAVAEDCQADDLHNTRVQPEPQRPGVAEVAALSASGALDDASVDDRSWFARHIGRNHRIRPAVGAERRLLALSPGFRPMVAVRQGAPGTRLRAPFGWRASEPPPLNSEAAAAAVFKHAISDRDATIVERVPRL